MFSQYWQPDPEEEQKWLPGTFISPLLRWRQAWCPLAYSKDWVDWDYQSWLEAEYADTVSSITPYMKSMWLPDFLFKPCVFDDEV